MESSSTRLVRLQAALWIFSALLFYLRHKIPAYPTLYVVTITLNSFTHFILIFYGYLWLYRRHYQRMRRPVFILVVTGLMAVIVAMKITLENTLVARTTHKIFFRLFYSDKVLVTPVHLFNALSACFFVLLTAILYSYFRESLLLKARQAEIGRQHMEAELNGLKAQVQPHFLFNSLNNLYYDTYKAVPPVAERIAMLSDIMRYFMEESPKAVVPLQTELEFLNDFIQLEKVRHSYPITIEMDVRADPRLLLPPMLLIPLVENTFKHGLSEKDQACCIRIAIIQEKRVLRVTTVNRHIPAREAAGRQGRGLQNLQERLHLLFGPVFGLRTRRENGNFIAELIIPIQDEMRDR